MSTQPNIPVQKSAQNVAYVLFLIMVGIALVLFGLGLWQWLSSWQTSSRGKSTSRILSFKFVQGNGEIWKRFPIFKYDDVQLEAFVTTIESTHSINTNSFWKWKT